MALKLDRDYLPFLRQSLDERSHLRNRHQTAGDAVPYDRILASIVVDSTYRNARSGRLLRREAVQHFVMKVGHSARLRLRRLVCPEPGGHRPELREAGA